jgi:hypothetical protein
MQSLADASGYDRRSSLTPILREQGREVKRSEKSASSVWQNRESAKVRKREEAQ